MNTHTNTNTNTNRSREGKESEQGKPVQEISLRLRSLIQDLQLICLHNTYSLLDSIRLISGNFAII